MVDFDWVDKIEAFCFTVIIGLSAEEVIRRLGGDPACTRMMTFDECFWSVDEPQWVQVGAVDGGVLVAEHNGWRGEELAVELSVGGRLACFCRDVHAVMRFVYAVDGVLALTFDPLVDRHPGAGADPDLLQPYLAGLPFGLHAAEPSALTLMERMTGVRVTEEWLHRRQPAVELPPPR